MNLIIQLPASRQKIFTIMCSILLAMSLIATTTNTSPASALSGSEFNSGNIIDDATFYNKASMSVSQIQAFLNAKVPSCDTNGSQSYAGTTRKAYAASKGVSTPFICLKNYSINTSTIAPDSGLCNGYTGSPGSTKETAAQIIYNVAQSCGISPKVLLVMLEKEQSLITDDWPWPVQYQKAMGAFCPDTAPCDSGYAGFFKQVYYGAHRFKVYAANPDSFNYKAGRNNTIYYHPGPCKTYDSQGSCTTYYGQYGNAPDIEYCGSSTVFIQNQATASLYIYTPYQPNKSALDNLYGEGDKCGAYGNRNFWRLFRDWFGSTSSIPFSAAYSGQTANPSIAPGETDQVSITYTNVGSKTWYDDTGLSSAPSGTKPVRLATTNPINRSSAFYDSSWASGNRPAGTFSTVYKSDGTAYSTNPHAVKPGESARFSFIMSALDNYTPGTYREFFVPVHDGGTGVIPTNLSTWLDVSVENAPSARPIQPTINESVTSLSSKTVTYQFKNTGSTTWNSTNTYLDVVSGDAARFRASGWLSDTRLSRLSQSSVAPGETGSFLVRFEAPYTQEAINRSFAVSPSVGSQSIGLTNTKTNLNVPKPVYKASFAGQSNFPSIQQNSTNNAYFLFKNTGTIAWYDTTSASTAGSKPVVLAATSPINRVSRFNALFARSNRPAVNFAAVYESNGTTLAANQHVAQPGQIVRFNFTFSVPQNTPTGTYREMFQPILEGGSPWDMGQKAWLDVTVC